MNEIHNLAALQAAKDSKITAASAASYCMCNITAEVHENLYVGPYYGPIPNIKDGVTLTHAPDQLQLV